MKSVNKIFTGFLSFGEVFVVAAEKQFLPSLPLWERGSITTPAGVRLGWRCLSFGVGTAGQKAARCLYRSCTGNQDKRNEVIKSRPAKKSRKSRWQYKATSLQGAWEMGAVPDKSRPDCRQSHSPNSRQISDISLGQQRLQTKLLPLHWEPSPSSLQSFLHFRLFQRRWGVIRDSRLPWQGALHIIK